MTRFVLTISTMTALLMTGCVGTMGEEGGHVDSIQGSLGDVSFEGTPEFREAYIDDRELKLDLRIQDTYGNWAMVAITIPRDRRAEEEVGSTSLALRPDDAEMVGCSGPGDGDWDYDCNPDNMGLDVTDLGDGVRVDFEGTFTEACSDIPYGTPPDVVEGSVDLI